MQNFQKEMLNKINKYFGINQEDSITEDSYARRRSQTRY